MRDKKSEKLIDNVAVSLCADYFRRRDCIMKMSTDKRVRMEYAYINAKILDAAASIVGFPFAEIFIREIGFSIGYSGSEIDNMCECTYKQKKKEVKEAILRNIYYI